MLRFGRDFKPSDRKGKSPFWGWLKTVCFYCFIFFITSLAGGEEISPSVIDSIEVKVDGMVAGREIRALIPLKEGDPVSMFLLRQVIGRLYLTGLFSDIQVYRRSEAPASFVFDLKRKVFLRQVSFMVEGGLSPEKIRSEVMTLRTGEPFDEVMREQAKAEIKKFLEREGYFDPDIQVFENRFPEAGQVDLSWKVSLGQRRRVRQVKFSGEEANLEAREKNFINFQPGDDFIPREVEERCQSLAQALRRRGFFRANVSWEAKLFPEERAADLEIRVSLGEKVVFAFKGAKIPAPIISSLWEERVLEEWALKEGEARILRYLRRKGYVLARVDSVLERKDGEISVTYNIEPGAKYRIREVVFSGQHHFAAEKLSQVLGVSSRTPFSGVVDGERVYELPSQLEAFYQTQGFPQARVFLDLRQEKRDIIARLHIEEGPQEKIGSIHFPQGLTFAAAELQPLLYSRPGGPYYPPFLRVDRQNLIDFYQQQGFRGTSVQVEEKEEEPGIHSLYWHIEEGQRFRVRHIFFSGAVVTKEVTIKKELRIKEGEWADQNAIQASKRNLERLGIFAEVAIEEIPVREGEIDLLFRLREGERNYASVGLGLETKTEPRSFAVWNNVLRLRATAEMVRSNLLGDASQLSLVSQMSLKETRGVLSWEQPYLFNLPLRTYLNAWLEREERISFGFDRRGVSWTGIKALTGDLMTVMTLRYARTVLTHLEIAESEVDRQFFPFSSTSVSVSLLRDRRDDTFNPERGHFESVVFEWAYPLFRAEAEFLKTFIKYQRFFSLAPEWNLSSTFRLGLGRGRIPIHERFFAGGSNSFRGEEFDALGPKDPSSGKPVGGKAVILLNLEFRFPLLVSVPNLRGAVFYDLGNVFSKRSQFALSSLENALGFGLRYRTPMGPVRLDLAWNLSDKGRAAKPLLFITIGHMF